MNERMKADGPYFNERLSRRFSALDDKCHSTSVSVHLLLGKFMSVEGLESRVIHLLHLRMSVQEGDHFVGVVAVTSHADVESVNATKQKERVEG